MLRVMLRGRSFVYFRDAGIRADSTTATRPHGSDRAGVEEFLIWWSGSASNAGPSPMQVRGEGKQEIVPVEEVSGAGEYRRKSVEGAEAVCLTPAPLSVTGGERGTVIPSAARI